MQTHSGRPQERKLKAMNNALPVQALHCRPRVDGYQRYKNDRKNEIFMELILVGVALITLDALWRLMGTYIFTSVLLIWLGGLGCIASLSMFHFGPPVGRRWDRWPILRLYVSDLLLASLGAWAISKGSALLGRKK
jgi:hypothetical protein